MGVQVVWPSGAMALLTQLEADRISLKSQGELGKSCSSRGLL